MQLFKVVAKRYRAVPLTQGSSLGVDIHESTGFPSRAQAASFARGLAEAGRCDSATIEPYDDGQPEPIKELISGS